MDVSHDLAAFEAMAGELTDYLASDVLFWQMDASSQFPKLSLGQLLLVWTRLRAAVSTLPPVNQTRAVEMAARVQEVLLQKPVAAERKAQKELATRLNIWASYLQDLAERPEEADHYHNEVTQRVIAALLLGRFPRLTESPEAQRLGPLDARLRGRFKKGAFVWLAQMENLLNQSDFWFLYGRP